MSSRLPKIIIADDHEMFREALKMMLELDNIAEIIFVAPNGKELLEHLHEAKPDIILLDIDMPILNGLETARIVNENYPDIKIIGLSMYGDEKFYKEMIEAGAVSFLLKTSGKIELENAINAVFNGEEYFSDELFRIIISNFRGAKTVAERKPKIQFSKKETQLLEQLSLGLSTKEIADNLFLSPKTIENNRIKLLQKTGCKNSISLVVYAIKNDVVQI